MSTLRLTLIALLAAASLAAGLGAAAMACNEECTAGFVFDDAEGVCVRADVSS